MAKVAARFVKKRRSVKVKVAGPNAYLQASEDERRQLQNDFAALRVDRMQEFLVAHGLPKVGAKADLVSRVVAALEAGSVTLDQFLEFLDEQALWGKQHVYLFGSPANRGSPSMRPDEWRNPEWLKGHLAEHRVAGRLNQRRPLILPQKLELVTISSRGQALRAVAVQRREGWERLEDLDEEREPGQDGEVIEMRAFRRIVTRGLVSFEWDLATNVGMMQITQLPSHHRYDDAAKDFSELVKKWLPLDRFPPLSLGKAVLALHKESKATGADIRAHGVELEGVDGRRLHGRSKKAKQPLKGNPVIDQALDSMSQANGLGHQGNFFFIQGVGVHGQPPDEAHVRILAGDAQRVNFATPQNEATVRNVLQRVRAACR